MGVVYAARNDRLQRTVALKTMASLGDDEMARKRFWREARAAASVNHPNICQIYEIGEDDGQLFIAMELLEGESLADRLRRGSLNVSEAMPIGLGILAALSTLHTRGIVHREVGRVVPSFTMASRNPHETRNRSRAGGDQAGRLCIGHRGTRDAGGARHHAATETRRPSASGFREDVRSGLAPLGIPPHGSPSSSVRWMTYAACFTADFHHRGHRGNTRERHKRRDADCASTSLAASRPTSHEMKNANARQHENTPTSCIRIFRFVWRAACAKSTLCPQRELTQSTEKFFSARFFASRCLGVEDELFL
jgi:hypothetical protein